MLKHKVTSELSRLIMTIRNQNGIESRELASAIGKSPSYVSKLEKGEIKKISMDNLKMILDYIVTTEDDADENIFYNSKLPVIIRILNSFVEDKAFRRQGWLLQLDLIERPISVSEELAKEIESRMEKLEINADILSKEIVRVAYVEMTSGIKVDTITYEEQGGNIRLLFHSSMNADYIRDITSYTRKRSNYISLNEIVYNLIRMENYGKDHLDVEEAKHVLQECNALLERHGVFPLIENRRLYADNLLLEQERVRYGRIENSFTIQKMNEIMEILSKINQYDSSLTSSTLTALQENMIWDPAFMVKLLSFRFSSLGKVSRSRKIELLNRIEELLEDCSRLDEMEREYEPY